MILRRKRILIISPQDWNHIKVSKHHYALELAAKGNEVYFLNPPDKGFKYLRFKKEKINTNLYSIYNSIFFPYAIKFHFDWLFKILWAIHTKRVLRYIGDIDIVWSFSPAYTNLNDFGANLNIYHPVDSVLERDFVTPSFSADYIFGVTEGILSKFSHPKKYLINHGLSSTFFLKEYNHYTFSSDKEKNVCYCGNLNMPTIDRNLLKELVENNPEIKFHFIGPYVESDPIFSELFKFLKKSQNVILYGKVTPEEVAMHYCKMDAFIICYERFSKTAHTSNHSSNSHKILEYLSTGKVVISTNMSSYNDNEGLIEMLDTDSNNGFLTMFKGVMNELEKFNSPSKRYLRMQYARENSYIKRIEEIERILLNN